MKQWLARIGELDPFILDPCKEVELRRDALGDSRRRWANQRRKRAHILSTTRQIVAEQGLDKVQITQVAEQSGVSVQTIYNVIGNRHDLLAAAASEWVAALAEKGEEFSRATDGNAVFATIELFWAGAIIHGEYTQKLIRAQAQSSLLERPFLAVTERTLAGQLNALRDTGALSRWANVALLAHHLAAISHASVRDWLAAPYDENRFRDQLIVGCGLMLRGACQGPEVERIERALG